MVYVGHTQSVCGTVKFFQKEKSFTIPCFKKFSKFGVFILLVLTSISRNDPFSSVW